MLRRRGSGGAGLSEGGLGTNTRFARFRNKIFANRVFARFCECKMHVFLKAYAIVLSLKYLGLAGFRNYDFAGIHNLLHTFALFANMVSAQCFAHISQAIALAI